MPDAARRPFNTRAFTALTAAASGLGLLVTGLRLHVGHGSPAGAAPHTFLAAHMLLAALFVLSGAWHAVLNGRALTRHLTGLGRRVGLSREAAAAFGLVAVALLLAAGHSAAEH